MDYKEKASLCLIHSIIGVSNSTLYKIVEHFGSFSACLEAEYKDLQKSFLSPSICDGIIKSRHECFNYMDSLINDDIKIITISDEEYPQLLKNIANPPYILYGKGDINLLNEFCIAVVGARAATQYGKKVAYELGKELAAHDVVTVSGMARGIDSEVHKGSLQAQGKTIAVLGSGIKVIYPKENTELYKNICQEGLVISEFAPQTWPEPFNFPMRNRIISGLRYGVVGGEARIKRGALITSDFALEQGRDVFAVPGPITSKNSEGTNNLIKQGAKLITCVEDILEEYSRIKSFKPGGVEIVQAELPLLSDKEQLLLNVLDFEPVHFESILNNTSFEIGELSTLLLDLQFKGIVKAMPGNYYVKIIS
ncbi:MAG: DNA-protecting protein DprA [Syntrophomonadaceae bacterium]|nr:DNA-protecting protein DprA [Syntrophomonadaceae bacterium]